MKTVYQIFTSFLCLACIGVAEAQTNKTDVLNAIDELYENIAQSDKDQTDYATLLEKVLAISEDIGVQQSGFVCVKSGSSSDDWYLYDPKTGSTVGSGTYSSECTSAVEASKNEFVCAKSGSSSNDWYLYDSKKGSMVGSGTYSNECTSAVETSKNGFICVKSGSGSDDWYLYDSKTGSTVGSGDYYSSCTSALK